MKRINTSITAVLFVVALALMWTGNSTQTSQAHPEYGCESCHVPHGASTELEVPLWNPEHTTTTLTGNYSSPTMNATTSAPDGSSKLCLSCHDGSYDHVSPEHSFTEVGLGGLETSHPISFVYDQTLADADGELVDPSTLAPDILDRNEKMQCTSCHDVHATFAADPNLRWPYENEFGAGGAVFNNAAFCRNCHEK